MTSSRKISVTFLSWTSAASPLSNSRSPILHHRIQSFAFIPGYKQHRLAEQDPSNFKAVELLGLLHDVLEAGGYSGHDLERVLFCLFAEHLAFAAFNRDMRNALSR